jgi:hypothetical protein
MIDKFYITEEEAAHRYGYSKAWFKYNRFHHKGPDFIRVQRGKVLYPLASTDKWFSEHEIFSEKKEN